MKQPTALTRERELHLRIIELEHSLAGSRKQNEDLTTELLRYAPVYYAARAATNDMILRLGNTYAKRDAYPRLYILFDILLEEAGKNDQT